MDSKDIECTDTFYSNSAYSLRDSKGSNGIGNLDNYSVYIYTNPIFQGTGYSYYIRWNFKYCLANFFIPR